MQRLSIQSDQPHEPCCIDASLCQLLDAYCRRFSSIQLQIKLRRVSGSIRGVELERMDSSAAIELHKVLVP